MRPEKRPTARTLDAYAAGTLPTGPALVVETHLALSPASRTELAALEQRGGAMLDGLAPVPLNGGALARVLARTGTPPEPPPAPPVMNELPEPLSHHPMGRWQWGAPGVRFRRVHLSDADGCCVFLLKIDPGRRLPQHSHEGTEFTCVISGAYEAGGMRFGRGGFEEAGAENSHRPVAAELGEPCLCVVALTGAIKLDGMLGRLLSPFLRG